MLRQAPESTMVESATRMLRDEILEGSLVAGSRIHLNEASARLSMSPGPIREALRELTAEGLVVAIAQRGYRVREISAFDLDETYRLRLMLDVSAIELAVPNITKLDIDRATLALRGLKQAYQDDDWRSHSMYHREFHFALFEPCASPWLIRIVKMLWENSVRYQRLSSRHRGTVADRAREHGLILEACASGNAESAAELTRKHLTTTWNTVKKLLPPDSTNFQPSRY